MGQSKKILPEILAYVGITAFFALYLFIGSSLVSSPTMMVYNGSSSEISETQTEILRMQSILFRPFLFLLIFPFVTCFPLIHRYYHGNYHRNSTGGILFFLECFTLIWSIVFLSFNLVITCLSGYWNMLLLLCFVIPIFPLFFLFRFMKRKWKEKIELGDNEGII
jgi:hypothetical protein